MKSPLGMMDEVHDEVSDYFRYLGFKVTWDFDKRSGLHWYDICLDGKLLIQIDFGVPLASLKEDFPLLAAGKLGTSSSDWEARGSVESLKIVVARMEADEVTYS